MFLGHFERIQGISIFILLTFRFLFGEKKAKKKSFFWKCWQAAEIKTSGPKTNSRSFEYKTVKAELTKKIWLSRVNLLWNGSLAVKLLLLNCDLSICPKYEVKLFLRRTDLEATVQCLVRFKPVYTLGSSATVSPFSIWVHRHRTILDQRVLSFFLTTLYILKELVLIPGL